MMNVQEISANDLLMQCCGPGRPTDNNHMGIDRDTAILDWQMRQVMKSLGSDVHVVEFVLPADADLPKTRHECDRDFHIGEAYLAGNQVRLAINRFRQALGKYDGRSDHKHFRFSVNVALAEAHSAIDLREWESALNCLDEALAELPDDDRQHAIRARVLVRAGDPAGAYRSSMAALKSNPLNFEAACYLGFIGFTLSDAEGDLGKMAKDIENLETAYRLHPSTGTGSLDRTM
jgi:tetratricopeptide (TPR) repeat protein